MVILEFVHFYWALRTRNAEIEMMWITLVIIFLHVRASQKLSYKDQAPSEMVGSFSIPFGERLKQMSALDPKVIPMKDSASNKFVAALAIIATPFALGAFMLAWSPSDQFHNSDPKHDGYVQPRSVGELVERTQESTVSVFCVVRDDDWGMGTAWAIELENGMGEKYPTSLITNHHVIEECIGGKGKLTVAELYKEPVPAMVVKWDEENDLAVLATGLKLKPLGLSQAEPWPGYWVMVLGSADGYEGSVSFGSVLNATDTEIFITANTSHGNSGGPLVDNEGLVIGTTSWGHKKEQYNGAMSLNAMCAEILECDGEWYWKRD